MKKFLKDLEIELRKNNLSDQEIEDILADHREMIETAIDEGLNDSELEKKFGNPKDVAEELSQFSDKKEKGRENKKMETRKETKEFLEVKEGYNVEIKLINEDVEFNLTDENKIIVSYEGDKKLSDYEVVFENNKLVIQAPQKLFNNNFFSRSSNNNFTIWLPKGVKVGNFKFKEVNGDLSFGKMGIELESFILETTNGDSEIGDFKAEEIRIRTVNGDISIFNVECEDLYINQVNGDTKAAKTDISASFDVNTVSGDLEVSDVTCSECTFKTVSGDMSGEEFYPESISLKSVSGDITIKNNDSEKHIDIKHQKSVSGEIKIVINK